MDEIYSTHSAYYLKLAHESLDDLLYVLQQALDNAPLPLVDWALLSQVNNSLAITHEVCTNAEAAAKGLPPVSQETGMGPG